MFTLVAKRSRVVLLAMAVLALVAASPASAAIQGITGATTFNLTAKADYIQCADGLTLLIWGFADGGGRAQYPGPTVIVNQGDTVTFNLTNALDYTPAVPVSMIFPGQENVSAAELTAPTQAGAVTLEALPGGTVSYTFTAVEPGTYYYQSGTNMDVQVEMGLIGALIVRPSGAGFNDGHHAYNTEDSYYDREYLFLASEMDLNIHQNMEFGLLPVDTTSYFPVYWFFNGRNAMDTMVAGGVPWLPTQPYNILPMMHPREKVLMRVIGAGRDSHPFHHHGNHSQVIAKDGRLLESAPGAGADLSPMVFTIQTTPGGTDDAIFTWTGQDLGWDIYGTGPGYEHDCISNDGDNFDDVTQEYCPDHGKPIPVILPEKNVLTFGGLWSGSPYMGDMGSLPPGEGGLNPWGAYTYMWHSHTEKELTNNDIFPGGMMTMLIIVPPGTTIME